MNIDLSDIITGGFLSLLSGIAVWIGKSIENMRDSISELNKQIALILLQQDNHKETLSEHDDRISDLEKR